MFLLPCRYDQGGKLGELLVNLERFPTDYSKAVATTASSKRRKEGNIVILQYSSTQIAPSQSGDYPYSSIGTP